jgi:glycine cleavage system H protein
VHFPDELAYTRDHEWAQKASDGRVRIGITDYAQDALGAVVFIQLPTEGQTYSAGETLGEIESTKSVSELYSPISGVVVAVNSSLSEAPEQLNEDPYGEGWICELDPGEPDALGGLLGVAEYRSLVEEQ